MLTVVGLAGCGGPDYPPKTRDHTTLLACENRADFLHRYPHMSDDWKQQVIDCVQRLGP